MRTCSNELGGYEELAVAIIEQAVDDYVYSYIRLQKSKQKLAEYDIDLQNLKRKKTETKYQFAFRKHRHSRVYLENQVFENEAIFKECKDFFVSEWLNKLVDIDGSLLVEECNKRIKQKGYEI